MKIGRCLMACLGFFDAFIRLVGPLMILLALAIIVGIYSSYVTTVLGVYEQLHRQRATEAEADVLFWVRCHRAIATVCVFNILFNYIQSIRVGPGFESLEEQTRRFHRYYAGKSAAASPTFAATAATAATAEAKQDVEAALAPTATPAAAAPAAAAAAATTAATDNGTFVMYERYCRKCNCGKAARTHHCSVCNRCVLKMDHHWQLLSLS